MAPIPLRRRFLSSLGGAAAFLTGKTVAAGNQTTGTPQNASQAGSSLLPSYATLHNYRTLKQSSFDRTGGNNDAWRIEPGATYEVFKSAGPGIITHIWYTISARSGRHLKELVMRIYWEGNEKPSVEVPVGDFFGLNLGDYFLYQSAFLNCSSVKALNSYFAMPFRREARITITNESSERVDSFYSNIDYKLVPALPDNALYFHAQYRQATPNHAIPAMAGQPQVNLDGKHNYVFFETRGKGQMMGVTMGVVQNRDGWFGEGDEMIFIDDPKMPAITGTGTEDYINGAWDFNGVPFSNLYNGAPYITTAERAGGRYCLYRWHADNPVAFDNYLKHTIEHGHANDRADCFYSVGYWYQTEPFTDFPALPPAEARWAALKL